MEKKKYQVFVSSTYEDLKEERQKVMQALLELDCIPVGMELFPAADEDQWTLIKRLIDDCDYYIIVIAGRYGSLNTNKNISYTEMEYKYAVRKRIPVIGFLHKNPEIIPISKSEKDPVSRDKLDAFKKLVKKKTCRFWESPLDLGLQVSTSLISLIKHKPSLGWVKAAPSPNMDTAKEILELKKQIEALNEELKLYRSNKQFSNEAKTLLIEASQDRDGEIMSLSFVEGSEIITNRKSLFQGRDPKSKALWVGAIEELLENNLVKRKGHKDTLFQLTKKGFEEAEKLVFQEKKDGNSNRPATFGFTV